MRPVIVAAALVLTISACGPPPSGVVVSKEYEPGGFKNKRTCKTTNGKRKCSTKPGLELAEWELTVRYPSGEEEVDVSEAAYAACSEGETYPACAGER